MKHPKFGRLEIRRSRRAKRLSVRIFAESVEVILPLQQDVSEAEYFVEKMEARIVAAQKRQQEKKKDNPDEEVLDGLKTYTFEVALKGKPQTHFSGELKDSILTIYYPEETADDSVYFHSLCWKIAEQFLRREANRILPSMLEVLAEKHHFTYNKMNVRTARTRWGSCGGRECEQKNINISFFVLLLPKHLIEYVLLHELTHTIEMNHGTQFWEYLDRVTEGRAKALDRELKNYHIPKQRR